MATEIINCCRHPIVLYGFGLLEPSGIAPRVVREQEEIGEIAGVPLYRFTETGGVEGLPPRRNGTFYVVPAIVKRAAPGREDLVVPLRKMKDSLGRVIGAKALAA